jgi:hypothetical protein
MRLPDVLSIAAPSYSSACVTSLKSMLALIGWAKGAWRHAVAVVDRLSLSSGDAENAGERVWSLAEVQAGGMVNSKEGSCASQ